MKINKYNRVLTVDELVEILNQYDGNLPCVITRGGKGHQYGIKLQDIKIIDGAYFGNDNESDVQFPCEDSDGNEIDYKFLNIGCI